MGFWIARDGNKASLVQVEVEKVVVACSLVASLNTRAEADREAGERPLLGQSVRFLSISRGEGQRAFHVEPFRSLLPFAPCADRALQVVVE